mmetsp:Transcript_8473/g.19838  ORF Transcript_8473/g.19838 Transcript_8473/m.19838 type:complete len:207 (+) Transcript_8473:364-984(+)
MAHARREEPKALAAVDEARLHDARVALAHGVNRRRLRLCLALKVAAEKGGQPRRVARRHLRRDGHVYVLRDARLLCGGRGRDIRDPVAEEEPLDVEPDRADARDDRVRRADGVREAFAGPSGEVAGGPPFDRGRPRLRRAPLRHAASAGDGRHGASLVRKGAAHAAASKASSAQHRHLRAGAVASPHRRIRIGHHGRTRPGGDGAG